MADRPVEPVTSAYYHARAARAGIPLDGTFELTARCNFDCRMCYVHGAAQTSDGELSAGQWIALAREARDAGLLYLLLTGGEPLVRSDFCEIYEATAQMGFLISVNTNGSLLTDAHYDLFDRYPPMRVNVSLYGADDDVYEYVTGRRQLDNVCGAIRRLRAMDVPVTVNFIANRVNAGQIEEILALADSLGAIVRPTAYIYPPLRAACHGEDCDLRPSARDAAAAHYRIQALRSSPQRMRAIADGLIRPDEEGCVDDRAPDGRMRCRAGKSAFWVTWDGRLLPCGMLTKPAVPLAPGSFAAAWERLKAETAAIRMPQNCVACPDYRHCQVCAAMCLCETGRFDETPPYMCAMTKEVLRLFRQGRDVS